MQDSRLKRWETVGWLSVVVIAVAIPLSYFSRGDRPAVPEESAARFVGSEACRDCHRVQYQDWRGSNHDWAMAVASDSTVLGDFDDAQITHGGITSRFYRRDEGFFVWTEGPGGEMGEFEIVYTFGVEPLQQYLVPFPGGRLQALSLAWDAPRSRWFHLYPDQQIPADDWLHWTRNGQNWNGMCAECHSTNLRKNFNPDAGTYQTTWSDINVGCEACHGPGSGHVRWAEIPPMGRPELAHLGLVVPTSGISSEERVELCAPCHSRRAELGDYDHGGLELLDHMLPALLREGLYHEDGQILDEVYVYGSFLQSKMYARGVQCSDCHDSHSLKLHFEGNDLCAQCHQPEVYDAYEHHFHKKEVDGLPSDGALCVKCHMVEQPYMVIDWRADHSFRVPRPDLSSEIGTPNACTQGGCHDGKPLQWTLDAYRKWYGEARRPHFGTTFAAAREGSAEVSPELRRIVESPLHPAIVRATALELLSTAPAGVPAELLEQSILSDEPLLRHTAVRAVPTDDPDRRVSLLAPLLSDPVKAVRLASLAQLAGVEQDRLKPYQQDAFARVREEYESAMSYSLDFASSGLNLGNLHSSLGQAEDAERFYRLALEIDDLFLPARLNLAVMLSAQGRNPEALELLRTAVRHYPDEAEPAYSLGLLLVEMGQAEEGVQWLSRAADSDPRRARIRYNLGLLLQQLGRSSEAEAALRGALALEPDNLDFLFALADHCARRGLLDDAAALAKRMITAHPQERIGYDLQRFVESQRRAPGSN